MANKSYADYIETKNKYLNLIKLQRGGTTKEIWAIQSLLQENVDLYTKFKNFCDSYGGHSKFMSDMTRLINGNDLQVYNVRRQTFEPLQLYIINNRIESKLIYETEQIEGKTVSTLYVQYDTNKLYLYVSILLDGKDVYIIEPITNKMSKTLSKDELSSYLIVRICDTFLIKIASENNEIDSFMLLFPFAEEETDRDRTLKKKIFNKPSIEGYAVHGIVYKFLDSVKITTNSINATTGRYGNFLYALCYDMMCAMYLANEYPDYDIIFVSNLLNVVINEQMSLTTDKYKTLNQDGLWSYYKFNAPISIPKSSIILHSNDGDDTTGCKIVQKCSGYCTYFKTNNMFDPRYFGYNYDAMFKFLDVSDFFDSSVQFSSNAVNVALHIRGSDFCLASADFFPVLHYKYYAKIIADIAKSSRFRLFNITIFSTPIDNVILTKLLKVYIVEYTKKLRLQIQVTFRDEPANLTSETHIIYHIAKNSYDYVILSGSTMSWWMGYFSSFLNTSLKKIYYPTNLQYFVDPANIKHTEDTLEKSLSTYPIQEDDLKDFPQILPHNFTEEEQQSIINELTKLQFPEEKFGNALATIACLVSHLSIMYSVPAGVIVDGERDRICNYFLKSSNFIDAIYSYLAEFHAPYKKLEQFLSKWEGVVAEKFICSNNSSFDIEYNYMHLLLQIYKKYISTDDYDVMLHKIVAYNRSFYENNQNLINETISDDYETKAKQVNEALQSDEVALLDVLDMMQKTEIIDGSSQ